MARFDYRWLEAPETLGRGPPEDRAFATSDLMARYRPIAGDGREYIGASIWEELIRNLTGLLSGGARTLRVGNWLLGVPGPTHAAAPVAADCKRHNTTMLV